MNIDFIRKVCEKLPAVTEDIKWEHDLCFCVGEKMFCVTGLEQGAGVSFKVLDDEFDELTAREGIKPAAYMARNKWIHVETASALTPKEWEHHIKQSYQLVSSKLTKKLKKELGIE